MTAARGVAVLADRAAEATEASSALFSALREALADSLGMELVDLQSRPADSAWVLICRFGAETQPPLDTAGHEEERWGIPAAPEPPFVSPILSSPPFEGDGSDDLMRFIEEADDGVGIPAIGPRGGLPPLLSSDERARMLASTIAGDVVLALMHDGAATDPARLDAALDEGWERYTAEVRRLGRDPDAGLYGRASELAAAMIVEGI